MTDTWGIVGKGSIPHVCREAESVITHLRGLGESVLVESDLAAAIGEPGKPMAEMHKAVDRFVTVGGDGTILWTQQATDKPVLGINVGAIGFLAEVEPPHFEAAVERIRTGAFQIEKRHKLACALDGEDLPEAVNEITLQTSRIAKLIRFRVDVDGETLDTFRGDGIIVSTPTGSTGYAMSVGGPLVHPRVPGIILAPIAPFRLSARPWVVPAESAIEVVLLERDSAQGKQQARIVIDGQHGRDVETGATLRMTQSKRWARFIRFGGGFYERVRTKLTR